MFGVREAQLIAECADAMMAMVNSRSIEDANNAPAQMSGSLFSAPGHEFPGLTLAQILEIENQDWLLDLSCDETGIPVWPQVRVRFIRWIMGDLLYSSGVGFDVAFEAKWSKAARTLAQSLLSNHRLKRARALRSDVMITTEAMADQLVEGRWFNRMADPFAEIPQGRTIVLADQHEWEWRFPRTNPRTYLHAPLQAWSALAGRVAASASQRANAAEFAGRVADRAQSVLGWTMGEDAQKTFAAYVVRKLGTTRIRYRAYRRLLQEVQPKLIVTSSACYGHIATMIAAARDLGIVTAEFQHGAISEGHDAYNFAPAMVADDRLTRVLPQYFLSYGEWWSERMNAPVQMRSIGYPARSLQLEKAVQPKTERKEVLVLGDGIELPLYVEFARRLGTMLRDAGFRVVLRPHPMERSRARSLDADALNGIEIDYRQNIYDSYARSHTVVSEISTGLFEAVGLVKNIILLDTAKARFTYPQHPFAVATSIDDVASLVSADAGRPNIAPDRLWQPDWRNAYRKFLTEVGVL